MTTNEARAHEIKAEIRRIRQVQIDLCRERITIARDGIARFTNTLANAERELERLERESNDD